jgi:hypothetical protein
MTRTGKIARLPRSTREELNRRLHNGEAGVRLADWLNGLPDVKTVLAADFGGRAISAQNLSEWKSGGYVEWQARQEALEQARELAADARELSEATDGRLTDHLATVLAARYAAALAGWNGEPTEEIRGKLRTLHGVCEDVVELRRGDHSGARLGIERERLEREREKTEEEVVEHFQRWVKDSRVRDWICATWKTPEEREARMREIFGLEPKTPDQPPTNTPPGEPDEQPDAAPDQTESR